MGFRAPLVRLGATGASFGGFRRISSHLIHRPVRKALRYREGAIPFNFWKNRLK